jgi:hypothetical protein
MTVHDNIDNFLVADLHGELTAAERNELETHLLDCAACRQAHQETKIMNQLFEEKLEKPDVAFEQRMLGAFRNRVPEKNRTVTNFIVGLMRFRSAQIAGVAAVLLALVQVGRLITNSTEAERVIVTGSNIPTAEEARPQNLVAGGRKGAPAPLAGIWKDQANEGRESDELSALAKVPAQPALPDSGATSASGFGGSLEASATRQSPASTAPSFHEETVLPAKAKAQTEVAPPPAPVEANRKLIRNAKIELEITRFDDAVEKITAFANEERGYIATSGSQKQANGKLRGEVVVKVLPENLDRFLRKVRGLGELKNQTIGTEDVTKAYFDTDSRLKNARVMEQRLIDMLKAKTGKVSDLLQVEKELGRVREEIEKMQGELKYWDSQVQFATVTIALAEKDLEEPAAFLLKERAQLALYSPEVEKIYNDIKALASPKVQITNAQLDRDNSGRVSARVSMLIVPEEGDVVIGRVKSFGRVENFQVQTERVAQGGQGMAENAKTKRDKVELNISLSRDEQEQAFQQTSLRIRTWSVDEKTKELRNLTEKQNGRVRSSWFSRDPNGHELANVSLRVPMKNYSALMQSMDSLGKVENVSVQRQDRTGAQIDEANAPADLSIRVYSQGNIVSSDSGLIATLRRTIAQGVGAIMWSLRMIAVALAFFAPWVIALIGVIWISKRMMRARSKS